MSKPILCLDFDGVIHSYKSGWQGADIIPDPPVNGAHEFLEEAVKNFTVMIYSTRSHQDGGLSAMLSWFHRQFEESIVDAIEFADEKPPALVTIDDRALTFNGTWPTMDELKNFKPWNKRICEHCERNPCECPPHACEFCRGAQGGAPGNENVICGIVMCDYCHYKVNHILNNHVKEVKL